MCARNVHGGAVNPDMPLSELSLADVKAILPPELIGRLKRIYACGKIDWFTTNSSLSLRYACT